MNLMVPFGKGVALVGNIRSLRFIPVVTVLRVVRV